MCYWFNVATSVVCWLSIADSSLIRSICCHGMVVYYYKLSLFVFIACNAAQYDNMRCDEMRGDARRCGAMVCGASQAVPRCSFVWDSSEGRNMQFAGVQGNPGANTTQETSGARGGLERGEGRKGRERGRSCQNSM